MINKNILTWLLITLLSITLLWMLFFWSPATENNNTTITSSLHEKPTGGDFIVKVKDRNMSLQDLRGKVVLIYFGYTQCPDICPTSLALMSQAFRKLDENELKSVTGLFISVDPKRDSPSRLEEYTHYFHPNIIGATATKPEIDKITKMYGAAYRIVESDSAIGYIVDHSSYTYIIDKKGKLRYTLEHASSSDKIIKAVHELLSEK